MRQLPASSGITNQRYDVKVILTVCAGSPAVFGSRVETSEPYYPSHTDEYLLLDIELEMSDRDRSNPSLLPSYSHKMRKIKAEYWGISIGKNVGLCAKYTTETVRSGTPAQRLLFGIKRTGQKKQRGLSDRRPAVFVINRIRSRTSLSGNWSGIPPRSP